MFIIVYKGGDSKDVLRVIRLSKIEVKVLLLMGDRSLTGYDIIKETNWAIQAGTIYPIIRRLKKKNLIVPVKDTTSRRSNVQRIPYTRTFPFYGIVSPSCRNIKV